MYHKSPLISMKWRNKLKNNQNYQLIKHINILQACKYYSITMVLIVFSIPNTIFFCFSRTSKTTIECTSPYKIYSNSVSLKPFFFQSRKGVLAGVKPLPIALVLVLTIFLNYSITSWRQNFITVPELQFLLPPFPIAISNTSRSPPKSFKFLLPRSCQNPVIP